MYMGGDFIYMYVFVNLKNKMAGYFTSKISLFGNSWGIGSWNKQTIWNHKQVLKDKRKVTLY